MSNCKPIIPEHLARTTLCLTGFTGYVGSHLLEALRAAGVRPYLIPRPGVTLPETPGADCAAPWLDADGLAAQLASLDDPVILNIAGHFVSRHRAADIPALVSGNLEFPLQVFEALMQAGHGRIVNIGTSWEYSDSGAPQPANLYAELKAANAHCLEWYAARAPFRAINLKLNDTYGGDDSRMKLVPLLKKAWVNGETANLGYRAQPINLLHITDVIEGLLAAAMHTADIEPQSCAAAFLLGGETTSLGQLVDRLKAGPAPGLSVDFANTDDDAPGLSHVWDAAPRLPDWTPRISLDIGMADYFGSTP